MRKGIVLTIIFLLIFIVAIFTGYYIYKIITVEESDLLDQQKVAATEITDECVEEYEEYIQNETISASSSDEKVTPNTTLLLKKKYSKCGHISKEYVELPQDIVNMSKEEVTGEYPDWEIESFSSTEITLYKEKDGYCNEHYILRQKEGKVVVFSIGESGEETLIEETGISTEYLPQTDQIRIQDGIKAYGKEELNSILEDFE